MTGRTIRWRPLALALALPVGGIAISYTLVIDRPLSHRTADVLAKVAKLNETIKDRSSQHAKNVQQLEQTQQQLRELNKLVTTVPPTPVESAEPSVQQHVNHLDSDITRLSALLALFSRHHVECVASQPVDLPRDSKDSNVENHLPARCIKLRGSFTNVHAALAEMQSALNCVSIVSFEMEAALDGEAAHRWVLIVLL